MKAKDRYKLAALALKNQWNDDFSFITEFVTKEDIDKEVERIALNNLAKTFLHFENLSKVKFSNERPEVFTKGKWRTMLKEYAKVEE